MIFDFANYTYYDEEFAGNSPNAIDLSLLVIVLRQWMSKPQGEYDRGYAGAKLVNNSEEISRY